jgi:hypothetical protein
VAKVSQVWGWLVEATAYNPNNQEPSMQLTNFETESGMRYAPAVQGIHKRTLHTESRLVSTRATFHACIPFYCKACLAAVLQRRYFSAASATKLTAAFVYHTLLLKARAYSSALG